MYFTLKKNIFVVLFCLLYFFIYAQNNSSYDEDVYKKIYTYISSHFPKHICDKIDKNQVEFFKDLNAVLNDEKDNLLILVDKNNRLTESYIPKNVILLSDVKDRKYTLSRSNIPLAKIAERPLQKMAEAAKKDGINIMVSSGYRSYLYQSNLFSKYIKEYGEENALTFSAPPGVSQHQLGTTIDLGSIDDSYADTAAGKWVLKNAWKYGWSLSYPKGMEHITGYKWESWHYRYLGVKACQFQKEWFDDVQQYMLEFIDIWKKEKAKMN